MKKISFVIFSVCMALCLISCASNKVTPSDVPSDANFRSIVKTTATSTDKEAVAAYTQGAQLMEEEKYEEAETYLREAVRLDADFVDALDYLGMVLRRLGRTDEAIEVLNASIERDPINVAAYNSLAIAWYDKGDIAAALSVCDEAIRCIPEGPDGYYQKGTLQIKQEKYKDALKNLEKAFELYGTDDEIQYAETAFNIGYCYYNLKNWKKATSYLEIANKAFPDDETVKKYYYSAMMHD